MNGLFDYIAQACQSLAATAAPSVTAMGIHIVLALATIMLVWFGVQEALASAHGESGFSMGRFLNLFMLLTFDRNETQGMPEERPVCRPRLPAVGQERLRRVLQSYLRTHRETSSVDDRNRSLSAG